MLAQYSSQAPPRPARGIGIDHCRENINGGLTQHEVANETSPCRRRLLEAHQRPASSRLMEPRTKFNMNKIKRRATLDPQYAGAASCEIFSFAAVLDNGNRKARIGAVRPERPLQARIDPVEAVELERGRPPDGIGPGLALSRGGGQAQRQAHKNKDHQSHRSNHSPKSCHEWGGRGEPPFATGGATDAGAALPVYSRRP